jgi:Uma2 family endonuclease
MAVMEVPQIHRRIRHSRPPIPAPRDYPYAESADAALDELDALYWNLDFDRRFRAELLEGRIIVSPGPVLWHADVSMWLLDQLNPRCKANGWTLYPGIADLRLSRTRDIVIPDTLVLKDRDNLPEFQQYVPAEQVLLVAEVVSPDGIRTDREVKWLRYAKAGTPYYLLIDRFVDPLTVTLFSEPGDNGYGLAESVPAGPGGGQLVIPAPFNLTLDAATLPWRGRTGRSVEVGRS